MTSTLWGFSCSLQRRSRAALTAQKSCCYSWRQGKWERRWHWGFRKCAANTSGRENKKSWVLNLGGLDIKICSLAWVEEAQHGG